MTTVLTENYDRDRAAYLAHKAVWDRQLELVTDVVREFLLPEFASGGMAFQTLCHKIAAAVDTLPEGRFPPPSGIGLSDRTLLFSLFVREAMAIAPRRRGRGRSALPPAAVSLIKRLVEMAHGEGLTKQGCYSHVSEILTNAGYRVTPDAVRKHSQSARKST